MAIKDKQNLITELVGIVLGQKPEVDRKFTWFINKHDKVNFQNDFDVIHDIFLSLNGDYTANKSKRVKALECDAFFGGQYNFMFEFDEFQHFSSSRLASIELYPQDIKLNFSLEEWKDNCKHSFLKADVYRVNKTTADFNFKGGRTCQRAYLDCFRDILPIKYNLNPTLRINEFEVEKITEINSFNCKSMEKLLEKKIKFIDD